MGGLENGNVIPFLSLQYWLNDGSTSALEIWKKQEAKIIEKHE